MVVLLVGAGLVLATLGESALLAPALALGVAGALVAALLIDVRSG